MPSRRIEDWSCGRHCKDWGTRGPQELTGADLHTTSQGAAWQALKKVTAG